MPAISPVQPCLPDRTAPARQAQSDQAQVSPAGIQPCRAWPLLMAQSHTLIRPLAIIMARPLIMTGNNQCNGQRQSAAHGNSSASCLSCLSGLNAVSCHGSDARHCLLHAVFYFHALLFSLYHEFKFGPVQPHNLALPYTALPADPQVIRPAGRDRVALGTGRFCGSSGGCQVQGAFRYDLKSDFPVFGDAFSDLMAGFCRLFCCGAGGQDFFCMSVSFMQCCMQGRI